MLARDLALLERFAELGRLLAVSFRRNAFFAARCDERAALAIGFSGIGLCVAMKPASATSRPSHHLRIAARSATARNTVSRSPDSWTVATDRTSRSTSSTPTLTSPRVQNDHHNDTTREVSRLYRGGVTLSS
jgi:hypothetical protein